MRLKRETGQALLLAGIYLGFGLAWIFFSDRQLALLISDPELLTRAHTWKGWIFVAATAALFFALARIALHRQAAIIQREREIEQHYSQLTNLAPVGIYHADAQGRITYANPRLKVIGDMPLEQTRSKGWTATLHPADRERVAAAWQACVKDRRDFRDWYRLQHADGAIIWVAEQAVPQRDEHGRFTGYIGTLTDVTAYMDAEERLRIDAAALENTYDGVLIADLDMHIISVNRSLLTTTGYTEQELLGQKPAILRSGRHGPEFFQGIRDALQATGHWRGEIWNRRKNGEIFPEWLTISTVCNDRGEPTHYVGVYTDISKLKESEEKLQSLAHFDPLTSLPNRLLVKSRLEHAIEQAERRNGHLGILFIDLDDFKKVNDSLGHAVGDELLVKVAERLSGRVRSEDTLARFGGDEFVVLLESLDRPEYTATVARALLGALEAPFLVSGNRELYVRGSIGISIFPDDGSVQEDLLRAADTAMYRAKDGGGNQFLFFTSKMGAEVQAGMEMEVALRSALSAGELALHFQPRVDLRNGSVLGAEALLRWNRPGAGMVAPMEFIPVAERSGLIQQIGDWVFEHVARQYRTWVEQGLPPLQIAVNMSARQFRTPDLATKLAAVLQRHDMPAGMLMLELTENMMVKDTEEAVRLMQKLKRTGVSLSLDGFGTGFSSLAYLARFPIDTLKIDASFVRGVHIDPAATKIVELIIELARGLKLKTIAVGVEHASQCEHLKRQGCDQVQGFFFSQALPGQEFSQLLRQGNKYCAPCPLQTIDGGTCTP